MGSLDSRLDDEDVQRVLARALELQAQSARSLTVAQVREIAAELSIPEAAVDQALSEYRSAGAASHPPPPTSSATTTGSGNRFSLARRLLISMAVVGAAFVLLTVLSFLFRF